MRPPVLLLAVLVSGVLVGKLTSKYLLVEVDENPVTKIAGTFYCKYFMLNWTTLKSQILNIETF